MEIIKKIEFLARKRRRKIGIGIASPSEHLLSCAEKSRFADILFVDSPSNLVGLLTSGEIDAAVRGNLPSSPVLGWVRKKFSPAPRAALLQSGKRAFFLGPVGIDEGRNVEEKLQLVLRVESLLRKLGVRARVGILAGGRKEDASRGAGKSLKEAEELVKILGREGIDSSSYEIRIEDAFKHCNVIIAPSGVAGNLIFRTLVFLGSGKGWGAPFLMEKVFIDTSRAKKDYEKAVKLACALANLDL